MKLKHTYCVILSLIIGCSSIGCSNNNSEATAAQEEIKIINDSKTVTEIQKIDDIEEVLEEDEEPQGRISAGIGVVYDGYLYYAINGGGCHTGIIERNLQTGEEIEVVSNEGTNGFSNLSIYDEYIYCDWDQYVGTDDSQKSVYRFSLDSFVSEKIGEGEKPLAINNRLYFWIENWNANGDSETAILCDFDIDKGGEIETREFKGIAFGNVDGYSYEGLAEYFYLDGNIYVEVPYEELGEYDASAGMYLWKENAERGIRVFDMEGNVYEPADFDIDNVVIGMNYETYGVDYLISLSNITNDGKIVVGYKGENEVCNYISPTGEIVELKSWLPAE